MRTRAVAALRVLLIRNSCVSVFIQNRRVLLKKVLCHPISRVAAAVAELSEHKIWIHSGGTEQVVSYSSWVWTSASPK